MKTIQNSVTFGKKFTLSNNSILRVQYRNLCEHNFLFEALTGIKKKELDLKKRIQVKLGIANPAGSNIDEGYSNDYLRLLNGNLEYVEEKTKENPNYFKDMAAVHTPKYMMIGCVDARVPPNEMTKTSPGEIFIHRNIANQVNNSDINCMSAIQYAVEYLKVEHVIVMGHTRCGGIIAATNNSYLGLLEQWLQNIKDLAYLRRDYLSQAATADEFIQRLTEVNIKVQALNVCKTPFVQKAWSEGRKLHIHGWLMDVNTGLIKDLNVDNMDWDNLKGFYDHKF